jgi:putative membrane protein
MMDWDGGWAVGGWLAMSLMMVVVWGLPIALVVWAVRSSVHRDQPSETTPSRRAAEQVLAERYARGEIEEGEFAHRREVLRTGPKTMA